MVGAASVCASVAGSYVNVAELPKARAVRNGVSGPTLTGLLGFTSEAEAETSKVRIAISNEGAVSFTRTLAGGESVAGDTRLKPTCSSEGTLSWSGSVKDLRTSNLGDPLAGVENVSYEFKRGSDGALYVTSREYGAGLIFMFLPFGYRSTDHYRFPAAE